MTADLDAAVTPVADALDLLGVPYYLAGSVISSLHGVARATADVDLVAALAGRDAAPLVTQLGDDVQRHPPAHDGDPSTETRVTRVLVRSAAVATQDGTRYRSPDLLEPPLRPAGARARG